jgi:thiosulfate/3-mercaptopyruvate sulfurtransferase
MKRNDPYGSGPVKWVSTEWLYEHLNGGTLTIVDVQPNIHDYIAEHIPGAIYLNEGLLRTFRKNMPAEYVPSEAIAPVFCQAGLKANAPTVVYTGTGIFKSWGDGLEQTMMAYSLARFGHENIYVLDGGLDKWKTETKPLSQEFPQIAASDFRVSLKYDYMIDYETLKAVKDHDDVILLDARPPNVYEGQGPWRKPGHIPGAINVPWASLMDGNNKRLLKPHEELLRIIEANGITPERTVICSCGTGREATNQFILFKCYFGYPKVKIYEGSFTEWTAYPENPTVTGKNPR